VLGRKLSEIVGPVPEPGMAGDKSDGTSK
jgi:hypothetical protein